MNNSKKRTLALGLLSAAILAGCATSPAKKSQDDVVVERAKQRWEAILSRDYATAYALYSPGYRSATSVTDFEIELRLRKIRWISAEYMRHECEESRCTVKFKTGYQVNSPVPGLDTYSGYDSSEDQWVKTGGEWWFVPGD